MLDLRRERPGDLLRPGLQQYAGCFVGQFLGAEKPRKGGDKNQERKHRRQKRQRNMARDRPTIVIREAPIGIIEKAKQPPQRRQSFHGLALVQTIALIAEVLVPEGNYIDAAGSARTKFVSRSAGLKA